MQDEISDQQIGAGNFTPTTGTGYSITITINPGGNGPTLTINRAKLAAAVLVAVQKGHAEIALDSASSLFLIRKTAIEPNGCTPPFAQGTTRGHCKSYSILTF